MNKILVSFLVIGLLAFAVVPVSAAPASGLGGQRSVFSLVGKITALDVSSGTVTVNVLRGNPLVKPYFNTDVVVLTTQSTRYLYKSSPTALPTPITFADLKVGDSVNINGTLINNVWTANRITVGANLIHYP